MVQSRNEERIQEDTRSVKTSLGSWSLEIQSLEREALNTYKKKHTHTHTPPKTFEKSWRRSFRKVIDEKRQKITLSSWHPLRKLFWFHFQATISIPPMDHFHTSSPPLSAISDELLKSSFSDAWVRDYQIVNRYLQSQFCCNKYTSNANFAGHLHLQLPFTIQQVFRGIWPHHRPVTRKWLPPGHGTQLWGYQPKAPSGCFHSQESS